MKSSLSTAAAILGTWAGLGLLPSIAWAGEYGYPKENPAFSVRFPDGWTVTERPGPAHLLLCSPEGDTSYIINLMTVPAVHNKADLHNILTRITQTGASGAGLNDVTVSPPSEEGVGPGARVFTKVSASGQNGGEAGTFTFYAFNLVPDGRYYAVGVAGLQAIVDAHRTDFERVALSIRPVPPR